MDCVPETIDGITRCKNCTREFPKRFPNVRRQCGVPGPIDAAPVDGPGTEIAAMFKSLGFQANGKCGCEKLRRRMNELGVSGCRAEFSELVTELRGAYDTTTWTERALAGGWAILTGLAFQLDWSNPIPGILTEAIRRAEEKEAKHAMPV